MLDVTKGLFVAAVMLTFFLPFQRGVGLAVWLILTIGVGILCVRRFQANRQRYGQWWPPD